MKAPLVAGIKSTLRFTVPTSKTVPALYPESPEFQQMPQVFATGFLVGLIEWACIKAVEPYQTVGTHIDVSHAAPTPPGLEVRVDVTLVRVDGRRLLFEVEAHDGLELISKGGHERFIIDRARFEEKAHRKLHPQPIGASA